MPITTRNTTLPTTTDNDSTVALLRQLLEGQQQLLKDQQQLQQTVSAHSEKLDILVSRISRLENVLSVDSPPLALASSTSGRGVLLSRETAQTSRNSEDRLEEDEVLAQTRPGSQVRRIVFYTDEFLAEKTTASL